ncbi:MAG TPA: hypothetical protein VFA28_16775 [Bryobacteraceae bacterium]|jgi:hypothetical protein|nr:hypothetical protein [Bryobacteraceae bacterium]
MTDWKQIALALGVHENEAELNKTLEPLARLEEQFRPLISRLAPGSEPALTATPLMEDIGE